MWQMAEACTIVTITRIRLCPGNGKNNLAPNSVSSVARSQGEAYMFQNDVGLDPECFSCFNRAGFLPSTHPATVGGCDRIAQLPMLWW